jgi:hypothetical protein
VYKYGMRKDLILSGAAKVAFSIPGMLVGAVNLGREVQVSEQDTPIQGADMADEGVQGWNAGWAQIRQGLRRDNE